MSNATRAAGRAAEAIRRFGEAARAADPEMARHVDAVARIEREQAIHNAAYVKGRRDYAAELCRASA